MPCSKMSYKITKRKVNCRQRNYKDIQNNHKEMQSDDIMTTKKHKKLQRNLEKPQTINSHNKMQTDNNMTIKTHKTSANRIRMGGVLCISGCVHNPVAVNVSRTGGSLEPQIGISH